MNSFAASLLGNTSTFAFDFGPRRWMVSKPIDLPPMDSPEVTISSREVSEYWDVVYQRRVSNLTLNILRVGVATINFQEYPAGMLSSVTPSLMDDLMDAISVRARVANALCFCLASAMQTEDRVNIGYCAVNSETMTHLPVEKNSVPVAQVRLPITVREGFHRHDVVRPSTLDRAAGNLEILVDAGEDYVVLAALLNHAAVLLAMHEFGQSMALSWTVCEAMLGRYWQQYYGTGDRASRPSMNAKRRTRLGKDLTPYAMLEALDLAGQIPSNFYLPISVARKARNEWVHALKQPRWEAVDQCIRVATDMLADYLDMKLKYGVGAPVVKTAG